MKKISIRRDALEMHPEQPWLVLSADKHYKIIRSSNPAISHFYTFTAVKEDNLILAIPDACVDIIFDCDNLNPSAIVGGTPLYARDAPLMDGHRYFGVRFSPGVIPDFIDLIAEDVADKEIGFFDVMPNARILFDQIVSEKSFEIQVDLFNSHFNRNIVRRISNLSSLLLNIISERKGNIKIEELERSSGYTCRTIQRQFRQDVGVSPKVYCRIMRCQSILKDVYRSKNISYIELAYEHGFSDQSHLLRDFKQMVTITPLDYLKTIDCQKFDERMVISGFS